MPYTKEQQRERAQRRAAEGLCRSCNQKATPGMSRCENCRAKRKGTNRHYRAVRLEGAVPKVDFGVLGKQLTDIGFTREGGVYFLSLDDDLQYIGKTQNLAVRLGEHSNRLPFNRVQFLPLPQELCDVAERWLIHILAPPYNVQLPAISFTEVESAFRLAGAPMPSVLQQVG